MVLTTSTMRLGAARNGGTFLAVDRHADRRSRIVYRRWRALASGASAVTVITALGVVLRAHLSLPEQAMLYIAGIMVASLAGRAAGIFAAAASVAAYNFFFVPPFYTFAVADLDHVITFVAMFTVGTAMGTLVARLRDAETASVQRERRTSALLALTAEAAVADSVEHVARSAVCQIERLLGVAALVLVPDDTGELRVIAGHDVLDEADRTLARWAHDHRMIAGRGTEASPSATLLAVPLWVGQESAGIVALRVGPSRRGLDPGTRVLLEAMARQAGVAMARITLAAAARDATLRAKTEELRSSLLSTVSHDLRTPLAVITGMATTLRDSAPHLEPAQLESLDTIVEEAARLAAILNNLLAITRVESGAELRREWVPVEELVGAVLGRLEQALAAHPVDLALEDDVFVLVDPILFEQVLINLIENAARHTPAGTRLEVAARRAGDVVRIEVSDRGPGLPPGPPERLFEKFHRGPGVRGAGAGLGLAVCRGIVLAHGGEIDARARVGGGATFSVRVAGSTFPMHALPALSAERAVAS